MTNKQNKKIRFVKCPKCARILPEPEQVPLYTCGGCNTILEAKYYQSQKEAFVRTLPTEEVVLSNGNGYTFDIGESSSSSQRSGTSGEHSSIQNGNNDENAVDVCISEQNEAENHSLPTSLSDELSTLKINESRQVIGSQQESVEALDGDLDQFSSEDHVIVQEEQSDAIVVGNRDHVKSQKENYACETSIEGNVDVLENGEPQQLATEDEVKNDENHQQEKCEDIAINKEKDVEFVSSAKEFALDNVARGSSSHDEKIKMDCDCEISGKNVSRNESNSLAVNLGKVDDSEKETENFVEQIREKVEKVPLSGDTAENGNSEQNRIRKPKDDRFLRRVPDYRRSSEIAFEIGSSSSYTHDDPPSHWSRDHPYEQRWYMDRRRFPEATWRESEFHPMYYNDEITEEMYPKMRYFDYYHGYIDRKRRPGSWSPSGTLPQTRYSGVQDQHMGRHSAQLPPAGYYRHWPMTYMDPYGGTRWDPYEFDPYLTNPYGWARDTTSDDRRHDDRITKRMFMRENRHAVKRHLRPIAGGAPFITCHFCLRVLQLPEEFIISKQRKRHRLKCGSCSSTLDFSLENESCLAPQTNLTKDVGSSSSSQVNPDHRTNSVSKEAHRKGKELVQSDSSGALDREMRRNDVATPSFRSRQVKVSWQRSTRSKSPLHRLMGYAAPEDLLNGQTANDSE